MRASSVASLVRRRCRRAAQPGSVRRAWTGGSVADRTIQVPSRAADLTVAADGLRVVTWRPSFRADFLVGRRIGNASSRWDIPELSQDPDLPALRSGATSRGLGEPALAAFVCGSPVMQSSIFATPARTSRCAYFRLRPAELLRAASLHPAFQPCCRNHGDLGLRPPDRTAGRSRSARHAQLCLDANPFDVAFEADGVAFQIVFDLEHSADLHEQLVVREPVAHLMGGGTMGIGTENRSQPPQVSGELLDRDTLLVTQFAYGPPVRGRRGAPSRHRRRPPSHLPTSRS